MPPSTLETWQRVAEDAALLRRAADCDPTDVASVSRLRKHATQDDSAVALELVKARRKAASKFPDHAERLVADVSGVEQATSLVAARHKSRRFTDSGIEHITDLCCGIGGDTIGLIEAGLAVTGVDLDPVRAWMTQQNAGCRTLVEHAEVLGSERPVHQAMHLDPARRNADGRVFLLTDYQPDPAAMRGLLVTYPHAAIKLSPAVNLSDLAERLPCDSAEVEFISEAGRLVQAVLWTGRLAHPETPRSATLLIDGQTHTLTGRPGTPGGDPPIAPAGRYLFTVDPAVERAGLMHTIGLPLIHPRLGLFTADTPAPAARPWLTGFELLAELPWHTHDPRQVRAWLAENDAGIVEIKTRGKAVDPDAVQKQLRGAGRTPYTVFVLRFDQRLAALISRRFTAPMRS